MNKKEIMAVFLSQVYDKGLMTLLIKNIFGYQYILDINYLYRMTCEKNRILVDIYDNISDNRFNRYVLIFKKGNFDIKVFKEENVFVTYINVLSVIDLEKSNDNLLRFTYLFRIRKNKMVEYARTFLDEKIVVILNDVLKISKEKK